MTPFQSPLTGGPDPSYQVSTLPTGAELYQAAMGRFAQAKAEGNALSAQVAQGSAPPIPPPEQLYAPYKARQGITFDVFDRGTPYRATLDDLLSRKEELGNYRVTVTDPNGDRRGIAVRDMDRALADGYKLEGSHETAIHNYLQENKGLKGDAKTALMNFADELFLGIPGVIAEHTEDPDKLAQDEALKHEHAFANALGGVAGFGGSLLVGGPLFKGAATIGSLAERGITQAAERALASRLTAAGVESGASSIARQIVAKGMGGAAGLGTEAAIVASPKALTEEALGDPEAAAETMLWSVGAGAALGTVSGAGKEIFKRAADGVFAMPSSIPGKLESYANEQALKSHNLFKKFSDRLGEVPGGEQAAGRVMREYGLVRGGGENFEDLGARITEKKDEVGQSIGSIYSQLDDKGVSVGPNLVADDMRREVLDPLKEKVGFGGKAKKIESYINDFEEKMAGKPMRASDLLSVRKGLDELVYGERMPSPDQVDTYLKGIRGVFKRTLDSHVEQELGATSLSDLKKLNTDYSVLSILEKGAQKNVGREITNRTHSLTDYLTGGSLASSGALAGAALGGPAGAAIGGGAAKLVGMFGNKYLRQNYNRLAIQGADKLGLLFAEQSARKAAFELDRIPTALASLVGGPKAVDAAEAAPARAISSIFGVEGNREEQYRHAAERLEEAKANAEATMARVADISGGLAEGGAPNIANAYTLKTKAALDYLWSTMPKPKRLPTPFGPKTPYVPSDREMQAWERRADIVGNPFRVFELLQHGALAKEHVEALQAVYPALAMKIASRIQMHSADKNAPVLPAAMRSQLSMLLGKSPAGGKSMHRYQSNFSGLEEEEKIKGSQMGGSPQLGKMPSFETPMQRISER